MPDIDTIKGMTEIVQHIDLVVPRRWVRLRVPEQMHRAQLDFRVVEIVFANRAEFANILVVAKDIVEVANHPW